MVTETTTAVEVALLLAARARVKVVALQALKEMEALLGKDLAQDQGLGLHRAVAEPQQRRRQLHLHPHLHPPTLQFLRFRRRLHVSEDAATMNCL